MSFLKHKIRTGLFLALFSQAFIGYAETVKDLKQWSIEGSVEMDPAKTGPNGAPSFKVGPKGKAVLKLRDTDGSGKVSLYVFDDGTVANADPKKTKSVGPRWGTGSADGRVFVGATMYGGKLHPQGSTCLIDTDPSQRASWGAFNYLSPRGEAGWKKWEFDYNPETGLALTVDGKPVTKKYFNWNNSKAAGFNGLVLYGDETAGTPQTIWISEINYELGPPMKVTPGSLPPPPPPPLPEPKGPAPEEQTEKSGEPPVLGKMTGFVPGRTLLDDLKNLKIPLVQGYASQHPRLLFSADARADLKRRAAEHPDLWKAVLESAKGIISPASVPSPDVIRSGARYWRIESVQSSALAWYVTGEKEYRDGAIRWMVAHCKEGIWGDTYGVNVDLVASWYLYHVAVAYDILKAEMSEEDRKLVSTGLAEHARYIYRNFDPHDTKTKIRYDQNHTYIPTVALTSAALALLDETPDAKHWLTRGYAVLRRCRYVLSEDGYYYEGMGYWTYALNWHARGAELLARATGEQLFDIPVLRDSWLFGLHLSLPGIPGVYAIGDSGSWKDGKLRGFAINNYSMLWESASQTNSGTSRAVGDLYHARQAERDFPATAFLWFNPKVEPAPLDKIEPYHYFPDQDVIAWRSGWDADATSYLFRCGPPLGHKAAGKLGQLADWTMNCGHVHPDIGAFWMFAKGTYLAVDTGYTAEKWTKDHNTLLVDEKGQGMDGSYWNERGIPYGDLDKARITSQFLCADYGYASGEFGGVYKRRAGVGVGLRRSVLMTKRWLLIVDDMSSDPPRKLTWLCHSTAEFKSEGTAFVARQPKASLAVIPLAPANVEAKPESTIVMAGRKPGVGTPEQRGFKLGLRSPEATGKTRFINLLLPLGEGEQPPQVELVKDAGDIVEVKLKGGDGKVEAIRLDLAWRTEPKGPATLGVK